MNKEHAVESINKMGKIGYIIAKICRIALIVGVIGSLVGAVILFALPNDLFKISISGNGTFTMNPDSMEKSVVKADVDRAFSEDMSLEINNNRYVYTNCTVSDDGKEITYDVVGGDIYVSPDRVAVMLLVAAVYISICLVVAIFVEKICKALKTCNSPFATEVTAAMERFAWSLIPWALVKSTFESFMNQAFSETVHISAGFEMSTFLAVFLIFGLVRIFKYGAALQQESDETL